MSNSLNVSHRVEDFNPFVVFGASKSGTTWIQRILDSHPQVRCQFQVPIFPLLGSRPELWHQSVVVYDAKQSPFLGVFKDKHAEDRYNITHKFIKQIGLLHRDYVNNIVNGMDSEHKELILTLYRNITRRVVQEILCDTNTNEKSIFGTKAYTDLDLLFEVFPQAKLIHIVRDGRDVCVSKRFHTIRRKRFYLGDERGRALRILNSWRPTRLAIFHLRRRVGWFGEKWFRTPGEEGPLFHPNALTQFAMDWKLIVRYLLEHQNTYPNNCIMVRYENLLTETESQLKQMLMFLDADSSNRIVSELIEKTSFSKLQGSSQTSFFRKGQSGDWRNYFTPSDVELFKELAGDLLLELGYESSNDWTL